MLDRGPRHDDPRTAGERGEHLSLSVGEGDLLFVRVGHRRRRADLGPWDAADARAGLHPRAMRFAAERKIGALGSDGNNDTAPSLSFSRFVDVPFVYTVHHDYQQELADYYATLPDVSYVTISDFQRDKLPIRFWYDEQ